MQVMADCVRMKDTLSTARSNIYDDIIAPLEIYRTRFLPVTTDAFLTIQVSLPELLIQCHVGANFFKLNLYYFDIL